MRVSGNRSGESQKYFSTQYIMVTVLEAFSELDSLLWVFICRLKQSPDSGWKVHKVFARLSCEQTEHVLPSYVTHKFK